MKNTLKTLLVLAFASSLLASCGQNNSSNEEKKQEGQSEIRTRYVVNGGFESTDLSGWTIEYGDAYTNDSVSSRESFYFKDDAQHNVISVNKTGNWYLSGRGFDLRYSHGRVGALRSNNFYLTEDGIIKMKLAGGALTKGKGVEAGLKNQEEVCYVGIYLVETEQMIHRQTNDYFLEHTEDYVDANKYAVGVYHTDNFAEYTIDLSAYANKEVYMRIVDNDQDVYYGYLSVDDIRVGYSDAQAEGPDFVKQRQYQEDVEAKDEYHIKNPDFEIGSLGGWTIVSGDAFSHDGVNNESTWWNENITYNRDGNYHFGHYNPSGTGVMRSSVFKLGGKGFVSFKLGGCSDQGKTYFRFMAVGDGEPVEIAKVSNVQYKNEQFPFVPMKMHLLNMVQYYVDLGEFVGENLYIEIVDNNDSSDDLGCMTFDSFETFYEDTPYWQDKEYYKIDISSVYEREPVSEFQVKNGTFETGDLSNWTLSDEEHPIGKVSNKNYWFNNSKLLFNKKGQYFFCGEHEDEGEVKETYKGTLTSSAFTVGGADIMTFRMSGGRDPLACYVSILDATTNDELLRFTNFMFNDLDDPAVLDYIGHGANLMNMILYKADLSSVHGRSVKIQVVDNATNDWGLVCVDSFITFYESALAVDEKAIENPNTLAYRETASINQVTNGTFETGDTTGWTFSDTDHPIMAITRDYTWWFECFLYNRGGSFSMNGWKGNGGEANTGTMTSSTFTLGGSGFVSYKLGGGKDSTKCYIEFVDADTDTVLATTYNQMFKEINKNYYFVGHPKDLAEDGIYAANMVDYKVDLHEHIGKNIKIRVVDNATNDWGLVFVDEFVTYYPTAADVPANCVLATQK